MRRCAWLLVLLLLGGMQLTYPSVTYACSCAPPPAPREATREAATVFAGTVTRVEPRNEPIRRQLEFSTNFPFIHQVEIGGVGGNLVTFEVAQVWKGNVQNTAVVRAGSGGGDCGYMFTEQQTYIVYTHGNGNELWASICGRTAALADAQQDAQALGPSMQPTSAGAPGSAIPILLLGCTALLLGLTSLVVLRKRRQINS